MARAIVVILDSFGLGAAPDAARSQDVGANTFGHIAQWRLQQGRPLQLPHLMQLGLGHAAQASSGAWPAGMAAAPRPSGAFGAASPVSLGKDTPSGHWELMGCPVPFDWGYFPKVADATQSVFPDDLMQRWLSQCGLTGSLGNCHASGTEIIDRLGDEHLRTGWPICYTSSDSVFQVAAHEEHFGLERLLEICDAAKPIFDELNIARVIARPFVGAAGRYQRTANRHDLTTPPPGPTLLDSIVAAGREVHAVGKIKDIFAARGISHHRKGENNAALCVQTLTALQDCPDGGLVFANLVDFDMVFGHRRDVAGYANALEAFDAFLPQLLGQLQMGDLLALSADHGCDPTWHGSDHTRENVPLLFAGPASPAGLNLGLRGSFADLGQTLARHLGLPALHFGQDCWA
ncbi:MAG: phosphopentomutase [Rhodoferax sp.]|nr:phosphopentomutase [Rhodoferax sp.]MDP3654086.1 phosphopentomutase [Rhodoferax sp.]